MIPGFKAFISTQAGVCSLLGRNPDGSPLVFPNLIPQGMLEQREESMSCLVFRRVGVERQAMFCQTDDLCRGSFEFDAYSDDYDQAVAIADLLRKAMLDYRGMMGAVRVGPVQLDTETEPQPEPIPGLHVESQIYTVWFQE